MHKNLKNIFQKAKRRVTALEKMELSSIKTIKIRVALETKYMSSDEECQDGFITHQNSRHTKENWIPNSWILAQLKAADY